MGTFVDFKCGYCKYEEHDIGAGQGKWPYPYLALFRCDNCRTIGSAWAYRDRPPVCAHCYHEEIEILDAGADTARCPKCGQVGRLTAGEEEWR